MFNVTNILNQKITSINDENKSKAENKFLYACTLLDEASKIRENKSLIKEAGELCIESIEIYPKLIDAYLTLSFIFGMYQEYEKSISLLNTALDIAPDNQFARDMLKDFHMKYNELEFNSKINMESNKYLTDILKSEDKNFNENTISSKISSKVSLFKITNLLNKFSSNELENDIKTENIIEKNNTNNNVDNRNSDNLNLSSGNDFFKNLQNIKRKQ